mgnify:CR=1 FL=1
MRGWLIVVGLAAGAVQAASLPGFIDARPVEISGSAPLVDGQAWVDFGELPVQLYFAPAVTARTASVVWEGMPLFPAIPQGDEPAYASFLHRNLDELRRYTEVFPDDISALTVYAVRLYQDGKVAQSLSVLSAIRSRAPADVRSGELYSGIVPHAEGVEEPVRRVMRVLDDLPENPVVRYNLACALALNGQPQEAFYHLVVLYEAGWTDLVRHIRDPDLASLRELPRYAELQDALLAKYRQELNTFLLSSMLQPSI